MNLMTTYWLLVVYEITQLSFLPSSFFFFFLAFALSESTALCQVEEIKNVQSVPVLVQLKLFVHSLAE